MTDDKTLVVCSHCAARLKLPANSRRTQFKCAKCDERTTMQLGAALARNTTDDASDQSDDLRQVKILLRMIGLALGLVLMAGSLYLLSGGCSHSQSSTPVVVVPER